MSPANPHIMTQAGEKATPLPMFRVLGLADKRSDIPYNLRQLVTL